MTDDVYTGEDAASELREERRQEKRENLKEMVDDQEVRVKSVKRMIERLEEKLEWAKEAKRTEETSLDELKDVSIEDFEYFTEIELSRHEEDAVTASDVDAQSPFRQMMEDIASASRSRRE